MDKKVIGNIGESIACKYLQNIGYIILEKNFYCKQGEIDIIAKDKNEVIFIEVKTRSNICYGRPRESVTKYKKEHILKSTKYYLYLHNLNNAFIRFDVIEVYVSKNRYKLVHMKNVEI